MAGRFKLGRRPKKFNAKTLFLSKYLRVDALPPPPEKSAFEYKIDPATIGMYENDKIGCCGPAAVAHHIMLITAHTSKPVVPDVADVVAMYSRVSGYDPKTGDNDNGVAVTDLLNDWQTNGLAGHKILGWAEIDSHDILHRKMGVFLFLAANIGVALPALAQDQFENKQDWDVARDDGGIEGGHDILQTGYGARGMNVQSWGRGDQKATAAWDSKYTQEAYIVITDDLLEVATGTSRDALDIDSLRADLAALRA